MTRTEEQAIIAQAVAEFPPEFGLRAFPGKRFKIVEGASYYSNGPVLYTYVLQTEGEWKGEWFAFAKGTPGELRAQMVRL